MPETPIEFDIEELLKEYRLSSKHMKSTLFTKKHTKGRKQGYNLTLFININRKNKKLRKKQQKLLKK